ncbi:Anoctamin [Operophtera brumata]|uniref:Anoctamin n=1 Tax=Operophtera brumata TaxID=104452 RepID=A0A0L7KWN0_OPEBR|nr:Anoctamin [Operophtera brumata]
MYHKGLRIRKINLIEYYLFNRIYKITLKSDVTEPNWDHIASLSGSDFDLAAHGEHLDISDVRHVRAQPPGPGEPAHV